MLELHPLHHPTIPYVEAWDDPRQQSRGRAGEGRSGRALRSCEPALEQRRAVRARQLGMELARKETLAAFLQRRDEPDSVRRPGGHPTGWGLPQRVRSEERRV